MSKVELSVQESLEYAEQVGYWDGIVAGAQLVAAHAKQLLLNDIVKRRQKPATNNHVIVDQPVNGKVAENI